MRLIPAIKWRCVENSGEVASAPNISKRILLKSIDHGADIVINSLTKWMGGHGTAIGGIAIDAGKFDWKDPKFSLYNEPDPGYHDLRYAHDLGDLNPIAFIMRMRLVPLRNLGACISPDNAWMFLQGLETLPLRMERHCENAMAVAKYLSSHPCVTWVRYPSLENDPSNPTARRYLKKGFGGMVVFGIKGGLAAGSSLWTGSNCFHTWPMWAMPKAWCCTPPARPIPSFPKKSSEPGA